MSDGTTGVLDAQPAPPPAAEAPETPETPQPVDNGDQGEPKTDTEQQGKIDRLKARAKALVTKVRTVFRRKDKPATTTDALQAMAEPETPLSKFGADLLDSDQAKTKADTEASQPAEAATPPVDADATPKPDTEAPTTPPVDANDTPKPAGNEGHDFASFKDRQDKMKQQADTDPQAVADAAAEGNLHAKKILREQSQTQGAEVTPPDTEAPVEPAAEAPEPVTEAPEPAAEAPEPAAEAETPKAELTPEMKTKVKDAATNAAKAVREGKTGDELNAYIASLAEAGEGESLSGEDKQRILAAAKIGAEASQRVIDAEAQAQADLADLLNDLEDPDILDNYNKADNPVVDAQNTDAAGVQADLDAAIAQADAAGDHETSKKLKFAKKAAKIGAMTLLIAALVGLGGTGLIILNSGKMALQQQH